MPKEQVTLDPGQRLAQDYPGLASLPDYTERAWWDAIAKSPHQDERADSVILLFAAQRISTYQLWEVTSHDHSPLQVLTSVYVMLRCGFEPLSGFPLQVIEKPGFRMAGPDMPAVTIRSDERLTPISLGRAIGRVPDRTCRLYKNFAWGKVATLDGVRWAQLKVEPHTLTEYHDVTG